MTPYPQANYSLWKFIRTNEVGWKVLFVAVLILYFVVVRGIRGDGLWYIDVFLGLLTVAAVIRDVRIRKRLRKLNATPGNNHRDTVCEGCNPPCWRSDDPARDGAPLLHIVDWFAAIQHKKPEDAAEYLDNCNPSTYAALEKHHKEYLRNKKFDKFRS